jgi:hypothetical protein
MELDAAEADPSVQQNLASLDAGAQEAMRRYENAKTLGMALGIGRTALGVAVAGQQGADWINLLAAYVQIGIMTAQANAAAPLAARMKANVMAILPHYGRTMRVALLAQAKDCAFMRPAQQQSSGVDRGRRSLFRRNRDLVVGMSAARAREQRPMQPRRDVDQESAESRRRIEVFRKLPVDLERPPVARAPFVERLEERRLLFLANPQRRATTLRVETHAAARIELEPVLTGKVVEIPLRELERVRAAAECCDHGTDVKIRHRDLLRCPPIVPWHQSKRAMCQALGRYPVARAATTGAVDLATMRSPPLSSRHSADLKAGCTGATMARLFPCRRCASRPYSTVTDFARLRG